MHKIPRTSLSLFSLDAEKFFHRLHADARRFIHACKNNNIQIFMQGTGINHLLLNKKGNPYDWDFFVAADINKMKQISLKEFGVYPTRYGFIGSKSDVYLIKTKTGTRIDYKIVGPQGLSDERICTILSVRGLVPFASLLFDFGKGQLLSPNNAVSDFKKGIIRCIKPKNKTTAQWESDSNMDVTYFLYYPKVLCDWKHTFIPSAEKRRVRDYFKRHPHPTARYKDRPNEIMWALLRILNQDQCSKGLTYWKESGAIDWIFTKEEQIQLSHHFGPTYKKLDLLTPKRRIRAILQACGQPFTLRIANMCKEDISARRQTSSESVSTLFDFTKKIVKRPLKIPPKE